MVPNNPHLQEARIINYSEARNCILNHCDTEGQEIPENSDYYMDVCVDLAPSPLYINCITCGKKITSYSKWKWPDHYGYCVISNGPEILTCEDCNTQHTLLIGSYAG